MSGHIALVTQSGKVSPAALSHIAAAVQKQVQRDLQPLWHVTATVGTFDTLPEVPTDYWRVVIRDNINLAGALGAHWTEDGQPFALVQATDNINRVCQRVSHEVLEMLIDPAGNRIIAGARPDDPQSRVNFIVEICDPTQSSVYPVNGVAVSDFVTPDYFGPAGAGAARFSYSGAINAPHQLLDEGYISWIDPMTDHLWQAERRGGQTRLFDRGRYDPNVQIRLQADLSMRRERRDRPEPEPAFDTVIGERLSAAAARRAEALEVQIGKIVRKARRAEARISTSAEMPPPEG